MANVVADWNYDRQLVGLVVGVVSWERDLMITITLDCVGTDGCKATVETMLPLQSKLRVAVWHQTDVELPPVDKAFQDSAMLLCLEQDYSVPFVGFYNAASKRWIVADYSAPNTPRRVMFWAELPMRPTLKVLANGDAPKHEKAAK